MSVGQSRFSLALRISVALGIVLVSLLVLDGWWLRRQYAINARILALQPQTLRADEPLQVVLAEALRQAALGNNRVAHDLYARVALNAMGDLRVRAEYNHANLLLREAARFRENSEDARAYPLIELAKESYRRVLREQPDFWDARYNLERALRWLPEPADPEEGAGPAPLQRERAPTTMRGETLGLP